MSEKEILKYCLEKTEERLQSGSPAQWGDYQFQKASEKILETTGVSISVHTLKRLFGRLTINQDYMPQISTRNALAVFAGYSDWDELKHKLNLAKSTDKEPVNKTENKTNHRIGRKAILTGIVTLLLLATAYFALRQPERHVSFSSPDTICPFYPYTARFKYHIEQHKDTVWINFGYPYYHDENHERHLKAGDTCINHLYDRPGVYDAMIFTRDTILKTLRIFVENPDWVAFVNKGTQEVVKNGFIDFSERVLTNHHGEMITRQTTYGTLRVSDSLLTQRGFPLNELFYTHFMRIADYRLSGDNFDYEVRFRNTWRHDDFVCSDVSFKLFGEKGDHQMVLMAPGCFRWVRIHFGEKCFTGRKDELSFLTFDYSQWSALRISIRNKYARVFFNETKVFETHYQQPIGNLRGLAITFKGAGETDYICLSDTLGNAVYREDF